MRMAGFDITKISVMEWLIPKLDLATSFESKHPLQFPRNFVEDLEYSFRPMAGNSRDDSYSRACRLFSALCFTATTPIDFGVKS